MKLGFATLSVRVYKVVVQLLVYTVVTWLELRSTPVGKPRLSAIGGRQLALDELKCNRYGGPFKY